MRRESFFFVLLHICMLGVLCLIPVVFISGGKGTILLRWYNVSRIYWIIFVIVLSGVWIMSLFRHYRCGFIVNSVLVLYYGFMVFSAWISVKAYQGEGIAFCYPSLAVILSYLLGNSGCLLNQCQFKSKSRIKTTLKKI